MAMMISPVHPVQSATMIRHIRGESSPLPGRSGRAMRSPAAPVAQVAGA